MPLKTPKKKFNQPSIQRFTRQLRSKHNSAPGSIMEPIDEDEEYEYDEPLSEDVGIKEVILKLNDISRRVEDIEQAMFDEHSGVKARLSTQEVKAETGAGKMLFMAKEYKAVKQDLTVVKGLLQKQSRQIDNIDNKVVDLTARSMAMNMVFSGLIENRSENCKYVVKDFLKSEMDIDLDRVPEYKIKVAHRMGVPKVGSKKSRPMIARVNEDLKEAILSGIELLEGRSNAKGDPFYVNVQQPEARVESRRNAKALLKKYQSKFPTAKVEIKGGDKVYVNNEWKKPLVRVPTPQDLYFEPEEQKEMNKLKIIYTQPEEHSYSNFWSAAVRVSSITDVQRAYNKICQDAPSIDHISLGYVAKYEGSTTSGLVDDKEHGGGHKILRAIRAEEVQDIAVFVARKFGGIHIGPTRFDIISKFATKAIQHINQVLPQADTTPKTPQHDKNNSTI